MKFGKKSIGAITAGLSLVMALSPVAAFAAPVTTAQVSKTLELNAGSTYPGDFTYKIDATTLKISETENTLTGATLSIAGTNKQNWTTTDTVNSPLQFSDFKAGTYAWTVTEDKTGAVDGMQYDQATYTVIAQFENQSDGSVALSNVYAYKGVVTDVNGTLPEDKQTADKTAADKVTAITFDNKYTENSNDGENKPLVVKKSVTGSQGDKTKKFTFTVTFTAPQVLPAGQSATDVVKAITANAKKGTAVEDLKQNADGSWTFKAADAGEVTFDNVLVGTTYTVKETEANQAGYETTGQVEQAKVLAETGASETVVNDKTGSVVTGVIVNNAPFIVMIGAAAAGVVAYGSAKRKLEK